MRNVVVLIFFLVVNKSFCQVVKIDSVILIDQYTRTVENKIHVCNVFKVGKDTVASDVFFGDTELLTIHHSYDLQSYISTELKFRNYTFRPKDAIILSNGVDSVPDIDVPLTYEPQDWAGTGMYYYQLKDDANEFVILDVAPYGCGGSGCGYAYYFIFNFSVMDTSLFVVPHKYSEPFGFEDNLFSIKDGELNLNLFVENENRECGKFYQYKLYNKKLYKLNFLKDICWGDLTEPE